MRIAPFLKISIWNLAGFAEDSFDDWVLFVELVQEVSEGDRGEGSPSA
jgi:hypothetical protein